MNAKKRGPVVEVLLATHNGGRFLEAQLDSLLAQTFTDFTVVVSDDASTDGTPNMLEQYARKHPGFLKILEPRENRLGACANFARLLDLTQADYVFFCDQDDIWLPEKMALTFERMQQIEANSATATPVLVHTDLMVVDENLAVLGRSFVRYAGIDPMRNKFENLLLGNIATGCTILINRSLLECARPIPKGALMFDFWLAQVAAGLGNIGFLDQATVLYRQHSKNLIGASKKGSNSLMVRVKRTLLSDTTLRVLTSFSRHAAELERRYGSQVSPRQRIQLLTLANVWRLPFFQRFFSLFFRGIRKASFTATVGLFILLLRKNPIANRAELP